MDLRPPRRLLLLLLHFWQCARVQSSYIIDTVGLTILPSGTVQSGTNVTLRCEVSISQDTALHPTYHFQFTKDDVLIKSTDTTEDAALYELNPARAADSGSYGCTVTVKEKSKTSLDKTLRVIGLQRPMLQLHKTTFFESEEFVARCSAPLEKGSLIFYFNQKYRTGKTREIKRAMSSRNSLETKLTLRDTGDRHLFCVYEIPLVGRSNHSNEIQVIVRGMFISPVMNILPSSKVNEGDIIEVVCKVVTPPTDVEVFLVKDKVIIKSAPVSLSHRFRVQEGDSGKLDCKAQSGNIGKETSQNITVNALFSKPQLTLEPLDLFEGDYINLTCSVSVYVPESIQTQTINFTIYKDNKEVHNRKTYITSATPRKNGNYTCKVHASSLHHSFIKESKILIIKAKVPVSKPTLSVVGGTLVLGKPFQLLCQSEKGTLPINYNLNGPKRFHEVTVTKPGEQAIFNTTITKISELNNFQCQARNKPGNSSEDVTGQHLLSSTTIIEPVSKPILSTDPRLDDITERQNVTLYCSVSRGSTPIDFTWYSIKSQAAVASQHSYKLRGSYVINNVGSEHIGGYYCVSTNQANETKRSETLTIGVKLAGWKKALIAIICLLPLLGVIIVVVLKKGLLRFRRKGTPELSVKPAGTKQERLSLTQAEVTNIANATPSMMGKSVWSEHVSGSESDDQNSVTAPKTPELQYAEVQTQQADPSRAPVKKGTDTTYSEVRRSCQGVPEQADSQGSVEYAELNHDTEPQSRSSNHDDPPVQDDHNDGPENCADATNAGQGE